MEGDQGSFFHIGLRIKFLSQRCQGFLGNVKIMHCKEDIAVWIFGPPYFITVNFGIKLAYRTIYIALQNQKYSHKGNKRGVFNCSLKYFILTWTKISEISPNTMENIAEVEQKLANHLFHSIT